MAKERARDASGKKIKESKKSSDDKVKKPKDKDSKLKKEKKSKRRDKELDKEIEAAPSSATVAPKAEDQVKTEASATSADEVISVLEF
jgi:hypothetical protein